MRAIFRMQSFRSTIFSFFFPPLCVHCRREGDWLCQQAKQIIESEQVLMNPLLIPLVDRVIVRGSYDCEPLAQLVQKLKYHYWTGVSETLETVLSPVAGELNLSKNTVIIPVPLHARRQRERGFNQSQIIGKVIGQLTGFRMQPLVQRHRYTTPQAKLSAQERTTNIIGAFSEDTKEHWPKSVILVDDVITTGSTIAECAAVLRQHGVQNITAVAIAKG